MIQREEEMLRSFENQKEEELRKIPKTPKKAFENADRTPTATKTFENARKNYEFFPDENARKNYNYFHDHDKEKGSDRFAPDRHREDRYGEMEDSDGLSKE